ncbi:MAG TPA: alanine racemase [Candidatus Avacidaminococcus intestinavium]|uniref:Alanine racemase n=1 Tax=Candidatus Avacidaminococcus intestinavium TaxID=2840684 RepID=A0A9D1MR14_9FIRM|nr:alanine racemase [Candidatus Avacidaminococcus intestinavium]
MQLRNAWAEIDLQAVKHNIEETRKMLDGAKLCAVVKADAYGHGAVEVAKAAVDAGAEFLTVAIFSEALELRQAGISVPILILGAPQEEYAEETVTLDISQTVFAFEQAGCLALAARRIGKPAKIHIAVETGMNRIGVAYDKAGKLVEEIKVLPDVEIEGCYSHFATADNSDKLFCHQQFIKFQKALAEIKAAGVDVRYKHIANSATITELPEMKLDMVRQGITLYGIWPSPEVNHGLNFKPVMCLKAKIICLKEVSAGESVGYGRTFITKEQTKIATLPIGYADGVRRCLSNKGYVLIRGQQAPIIGRVCMDQMMVDVTQIKDVSMGDEAILFGTKQLPVEKVAEWSDTIPYEVLCTISKRVPRVYKK